MSDRMSITIDHEGKPTGGSYEIRDVLDFLKIPQDRLSQCLREFEIVVRSYHLFNVTAKVIAQEAGITGEKFVEMAFPGGVLTWQDDGKGEIGVQIVQVGNES